MFKEIHSKVYFKINVIVSNHTSFHMQKEIQTVLEVT